MVRGSTQAGQEGPGPGPAAEGDHTAPARPLVVAVAHQKGGTGKTTAACNLAVELARMPDGGRVAVVDLDPQGTASTCLAPVTPGRATSYDLLAGHCSLAAALRPTQAPDTFIVPAGPRLMLAELDPDLRALSHDQLRAFPGATPGDAAYVLLDCPPGFGLVSTLAVMAADLILLPTPPLPFAAAALDASIRYVQHLRPDGDARLHVLLTLDDVTDPVRAEGARRLRETWGSRVMESSLPLDPTAERAAAAGQPLVLHAPQAPLALACRNAAKALSDLPVPSRDPAPARAAPTRGEAGDTRDTEGAGVPPSRAAGHTEQTPAFPRPETPRGTADSATAPSGPRAQRTTTPWRTRLLRLGVVLLAAAVALAPDAVFSPTPTEALAARGQALWTHLSEVVDAWTGPGHDP